MNEKEEKVPNIILEDICNLSETTDSPLRMTTEKMKFPLNNDDTKDIVKLIQRFEIQEHVTSLSLPQLGINKRAFIFRIDEEEGVEQPFPTNVWINPTYKNAKDATLDEGYEMCSSLKTRDKLVVAPVFRFNQIYYRTYDTHGRILEGEARGFAARVIQHEIDHLNGKLFVDYAQPEKILPYEEFASHLEAGTLWALQTGVVPEMVE